MKNLLFLIFTISSAITLAQTSKSATLPEYNSKIFYWKGGDEKLYKVNFLYGLEEKMDKEVLGNVVVSVMVSTQRSIKNTRTFIPKELVIFKTGEEYFVQSKCIGKNDFGVEQETSRFFKFDNKGIVSEAF